MMGQFERALKHLEDAEVAANAKFEETPTARRMVDEVRKVQQLVASGDGERALSCIKSIVMETPNAFPLQLLHAHTLVACGRFEEVLPLCQELRASASRSLTANMACDLEHMSAMANVGLAKLPRAVQILRDLLRNDPDNQKYQVDCKKVKAMHTKMTNGENALESHRFAESRSLFSEALALDPTNDRFAALMLSFRAMSYQKQREEVVDSGDSVARARKEVEEATTELEKAQRRMVKSSERLQLFARREVVVKKQFEDDEAALTETVPDPTPPHVQMMEKATVGKWALHKAIDDACQALDHDSTCCGALLHRARSYVQVGDLAEAVSDFERCLATEELQAGITVQGATQRQVQTEHREAQKKLSAAPLDHYQVLGLKAANGLNSTLTADEIKKAYRKMAIKYHPDKQAHLGQEARERMERRFKQISESNSVLSNSTERRMYDLKSRRATPSFGSEQRRYGASSFSASSSSQPHRPSSAQHGYSKFGSHGFNSRFGANSGGASSSKSYYAAAGSDDDDDFHF